MSLLTNCRISVHVEPARPKGGQKIFCELSVQQATPGASNRPKVMAYCRLDVRHCNRFVLEVNLGRYIRL